MGVAATLQEFSEWTLPVNSGLNRFGGLTLGTALCA